MIQANELRIGNVVDNGLGQWLEVSLENLAWHKTMQPIPLSPDILEKLWFTELDDDGLYGLDGHNEITLQARYLENEGKFDLLYNDESTGVIVSFVHQLQNAFYVFTNGSELDTSKLINQ